MKKPVPGYKQLSPPHDGEPMFTLRAKDNFAVPMLRLMQNVYGIDEAVIQWFENWRKEHPELCKDPD